MDEPSFPTTPPHDREGFDESLREGRARAGDAMDEQRQSIDRLEEELVGQIQRLGKELADDNHEVETRRGELETQHETIEHERQELLAQQQRSKQTADEAETKQRETVESLQQQLSKLNEHQRQLDERRRQLDERESQLNSAEQAKQSDSDELEQKLADSKRRFELAIEDLRDLKTRHAELKEKLAAAMANQSQAATAENGGSLDWEAQKRRLLASLDEDFDADKKADADERLTIEGTIQITDEIVASKQKELDELTRMLDDQSSRVGDVAVGAVAIAQIVDSDELIQQERARLENIQSEWKDKISRAEVDVSLERAKLARREAELNEKMQILEFEAAKLQRQKDAMQADNPNHGGWRAKFGLKDKESDE